MGMWIPGREWAKKNDFVEQKPVGCLFLSFFSSIGAQQRGLRRDRHGVVIPLPAR